MQPPSHAYSTRAVGAISGLWAGITAYLSELLRSAPSQSGAPLVVGVANALYVGLFIASIHKVATYQGETGNPRSSHLPAVPPLRVRVAGGAIAFGTSFCLLRLPTANDLSARAELSMALWLAGVFIPIGAIGLSILLLPAYRRISALGHNYQSGPPANHPER